MDFKHVVYLIHFERPYKHARHYLGVTSNLNRRLSQHRNGTGARLMEVISAAQINWEIVRTWNGGHELERKLKAWNNSCRLCPICKQERKTNVRLTTERPDNHPAQ